jgi:glycosyltransferase involved in cell wall biosynthesis
MADKLIELCSDPDMRKKMAANAFNVIQNISGQIMSNRYLYLIEGTLNEKKRKQ